MLLPSGSSMKCCQTPVKSTGATQKSKQELRAMGGQLEYFLPAIPAGSVVHRQMRYCEECMKDAV